MSYVEKLHGCLRRMTLSKEAGDLTGEDVEEGEDSRIGRAFHSLAEFYHLDRGGVAVPFETSNTSPHITEALRLFAAHKQFRQPNHFGEVIGAEVPLGTTYGEHRATGLLDLVTRVDKDDMSRLQEEDDCDLSDFGTGVYIWDHKVRKAHNADMVVKLQTSAQAIHYQNLWNLAHPEDPCRGIVFNVVFRYKTVSRKMFKLVPTPPPEPGDLEFVAGYVRDGHQNLKDHGPMWANANHCHDFHRTCPHFFYCDRTNK